MTRFPHLARPLPYRGLVARRSRVARRGCGACPGAHRTARTMSDSRLFLADALGFFRWDEGSP